MFQVHAFSHIAALATNQGITCLLSKGFRSLAVFHICRIPYFGIRVRQLMSKKDPAYRSHPVPTFMAKLGIEHIFTRPYTPRSDGKAERFIETSLREWTYDAVYQNSANRQLHLQNWIKCCNWHRPHTALVLKKPDPIFQQPFSFFHKPGTAQIKEAPPFPMARPERKTFIPLPSYSLPGGLGS